MVSLYWGISSLLPSTSAKLPQIKQTLLCFRTDGVIILSLYKTYSLTNVVILISTQQKRKWNWITNSLGTYLIYLWINLWSRKVFKTAFSVLACKTHHQTLSVQLMRNIAAPCDEIIVENLSMTIPALLRASTSRMVQPCLPGTFPNSANVTCVNWNTDGTVVMYMSVGQCKQGQMLYL